MGFKRKRDQDFRPRLSPAEEALAKARLAIAHIGEPSRFPRKELMENLLHDLTEVQEENYPQLLEMVRAVVFEQPHKIGYLGFAFARAPEQLTFFVVEMAQDEVAKAVAAQNWPLFKVAFRFLCALNPVIANASVLADCLRGLLKLAESSEVSTGVEIYSIAVLASLYLPKELISEDLRESFANATFAAEESTDFEAFKGENRPYEPHLVGQLLVESTKILRENDWDANILARDPLEDVPAVSAEASQNNSSEGKALGEPAESEAVETEVAESEAAETNAAETNAAETEVAKTEAETEAETADSKPAIKGHTIQAIYLPEVVELGPAPLAQKLFFRSFLPIDGVDTVPPENVLAGHLLRDVAVDNILHMDFNRREVVRQLLVLDEFFNSAVFATPGIRVDELLEKVSAEGHNATWKIEDIAVEAIFSQLFDLVKPSKLTLPRVYFHSLLIEACVLAPQDLGPVVGRGVRFLFNNLATIDVEILYRMIDWFAQHVSNFNFTWKWNEWTDTLQLPEDHPQQVFIREFLAKQVRLSYPERVREVIPAEFAHLVPNPPDVPGCKYEDEDVFKQLLEALRDEKFEQARELLTQAENASDLLTQTICHLGNRSVTHASTWIRKCDKLVTEFGKRGEIVGSVFEYWSKSQWVGALVIDQFVRVGAVSVADIIGYVVSKPDIICTAVGWELLAKDPALASESLESVTFAGDYGSWWKENLVTAFKRTAAQDKWADELSEFSKSNVNGTKTEDATAENKTEKEEKEDSEMLADQERDSEAESLAIAPKRQKTD